MFESRGNGHAFLRELPPTVPALDTRESVVDASRIPTWRLGCGRSWRNWVPAPPRNR